MKLAVIAPTSQLHILDRLRMSYHMALGQVLVRDPVYREWYRAAHLRGDFIIVDNGAAEPEEERVPFKDIAEVAMEIGADEIVMPDVFYDAKATLDGLTDEVNTCLVPPHKRLFIPQGQSFSQWMDCVHEAVAYCAQPFATIGVPKHLERFKDGRKRALAFLEKIGYNQLYNVHMFGIWEKPMEECLGVPRWVRGIDSGAPFAYAQVNERIHDECHRSLQWDTAVDDRLAEQNIMRLKDWANDNEKVFISWPRGAGKTTLCTSK